MTERLSASLRGDLRFPRPGETVQIQYAGQLLNDLRLRSAPRVEQEAGIRDWLKTNAPSASLARSLTRNGFGHLLDPRVTA